MGKHIVSLCASKTEAGDIRTSIGVDPVDGELAVDVDLKLRVRGRDQQGRRVLGTQVRTYDGRLHVSDSVGVVRVHRRRAPCRGCTREALRSVSASQSERPRTVRPGVLQL